MWTVALLKIQSPNILGVIGKMHIAKDAEIATFKKVDKLEKHIIKNWKEREKKSDLCFYFILCLKSLQPHLLLGIFCKCCICAIGLLISLFINENCWSNLTQNLQWTVERLSFHRICWISMKINRWWTIYLMIQVRLKACMLFTCHVDRWKIGRWLE